MLQLCPPAAHYYPFASRTGRAVTSSRVVPVIDPSSSSGKSSQVNTSNLNGWLEAQDSYPLSHLAVLIAIVPSCLCAGDYATQDIQPSSRYFRTTSKTGKLRSMYSLSPLVNLLVADPVLISVINSLVCFSVSFGNFTGFALNVD